MEGIVQKSVDNMKVALRRVKAMSTTPLTQLMRR